LNQPNFPFETYLEETLELAAHGHGSAVRLIQFPRILTREPHESEIQAANVTSSMLDNDALSKSDSAAKCRRFAWFTDVRECIALVE
jgi:hypothetical protein